MKRTILHSTIGVAGAVVVLGVAVFGNVAGQTAAPPAGLPPVSSAPSLTPPAPITVAPATLPPSPIPPTAIPTAPTSAPEKIDPSKPTAPAPVTRIPTPKPDAAVSSGELPAGNHAPAPKPAVPGDAVAPNFDPAAESHEHGDPVTGSPSIGGGAPSSASPSKGEFITREWKVSPNVLDDGHGGKMDAKEMLQRNGVTFGPGATATYRPESSTLVVRNSPEQIKAVEGVFSHAEPGGVTGASGFPGMAGSVRAGGLGAPPPLAPAGGAGLAGIPGAANVLPPPLVPPPIEAGIGVGSSAGAPAGTLTPMLKEFPVGSIEVARASLAADLNQDPQASASRYAAVVANFDAQRRSAATAVYGLGEAYRKMGRNAEARIQYARILREFVDFPELARQSQRQLSTTSSGAPDPEFVGAIGGSNPEAAEEERALVQQELALLERQLTLTQDRIQAGLMPPSEALSLQRDILRLKQQLVRLSRGSGRPSSTTPPSAEGAHGDREPVPARGQ